MWWEDRPNGKARRAWGVTSPKKKPSSLKKTNYTPFFGGVLFHEDCMFIYGVHTSVLCICISRISPSPPPFFSKVICTLTPHPFPRITPRLCGYDFQEVPLGREKVGGGEGLFFDMFHIHLVAGRVPCCPSSSPLPPSKKKKKFPRILPHSPRRLVPSPTSPPPS